MKASEKAAKAKLKDYGYVTDKKGSSGPIDEIVHVQKDGPLRIFSRKTKKS